MSWAGCGLVLWTQAAFVVRGASQWPGFSSGIIIGPMGFGGFSSEMIFLFFLALILFGPKKMPEIGRQVARILGEFRRASYEFRSQIEAEINTIESAKKSANAVTTSLQEPLGALASRILNPSAAEKREAAPAAAVEKAAAPAEVEPAKSETPAADAAPAPKVAHDA